MAIKIFEQAKQIGEILEVIAEFKHQDANENGIDDIPEATEIAFRMYERHQEQMKDFALLSELFGDNVEDLKAKFGKK